MLVEKEDHWFVVETGCRKRRIDAGICFHFIYLPVLLVGGDYKFVLPISKYSNKKIKIGENGEIFAWSFLLLA